MRTLVNSFIVELDDDGIVRLELIDQGFGVAQVAMSSDAAERLVYPLRQKLDGHDEP